MVSQRQNERVPDSTVQRSQGALRNSDSKLRSLFELAPVGMALLNARSGRFEQFNAALQHLLGYPREVLLSQTFGMVVGCGPEAAGPLAAGPLAAGLPAGSPGTRFGPLRYELLRADGDAVEGWVSGVFDAALPEQVLIVVESAAGRGTVHQQVAAAGLVDPLTGMPNRLAFVKALERAVAAHAAAGDVGFAVLSIDVDRFKLVNDTLGHAAGDDLLRHVAKRLAASVRVTDRESNDPVPGIAARLGSDEFAVLLTGLRADSEAIELIAQRLLSVLTRPYDIQGRVIYSSASIGVAPSGQDPRDALTLMQRADVAMYEAKQGGRARAVTFDEPMQSRLSRRLLLENDLREALRSNQLHLVYQPIVDLESGAMVSAEALVRWTHPSLGAISPAEFVPIAEESGLVVPLGEYVLTEACRQYQRWRQSDPSRAPETISINLSRSELALGDGYIDRLRHTLSELAIDPSCLQLEVTEREIARDPTVSIAMMRALRETGVRLAMDDFGTGASSLSCLRHLPFDTVKIDQSFLSSLESEPDVLMVLHATVTLIENLGMCSVAEGIERAAQVAVLQSIRCRRGQGYLFSRPLAGELLTAVNCLEFRDHSHA